MAKYSSGLKMSNMDRSHVGNVPYGKAIRSCTVKGTVALTYDDGPCEWTSDLLDLLKKNNVKATFFVIGWKICKGHKHHFPTEYASIIKRIYAEGHQIGSHTWSHQSMDKKTTSERSEDMVKMELALSDILGVIPTYWRPPFGECRTEQCQSDLGVLGYHTVYLYPF
jgi:peptidoglycan/xylan/chitin deacetylase (PgdA/CDA1 family)